MIIKMIHKDTKLIIDVKKGFSWTMLFFGCFVPLLRNDIGWFFASLILAICTGGFSWLILPFFYNSIYYNNLIEKGYVEAVYK